MKCIRLCNRKPQHKGAVSWPQSPGLWFPLDGSLSLSKVSWGQDGHLSLTAKQSFCFPRCTSRVLQRDCHHLAKCRSYDRPICAVKSPTQLTLRFNTVLSGECILLSSVLSQQRFAVTDIKALSTSQLLRLRQTVLQLLDKSVLELHVTALFYLGNSRRTHPWGVRACWPRDTKKREWGSAPTHGRKRESPLAPLYICLSLPWACPT